MLQGFKDFIARGNAVDMAVGIIIGAAFAPIVDNLTNNLLLPLVAALFGEPNFDSVGTFSINGAQFLPGTIVTALINFLLVTADIYFFVVVPMNKWAERRRAGEEEEEEAKSAETLVLTEIRDLLATKQD